jgi:TfoX/Sxy family transcriptional regulator of competence genes
MAYDTELADRIREILSVRDDVHEQAMFGGLAFLVGGHLAVSASGRGGLMVRVDPGRSDKLLATTSAELMNMGGRTMAGWLRVGSDQVATMRQLRRWVTMGVTYAASLPPKPERAPKRRGGSTSTRPSKRAASGT